MPIDTFRKRAAVAGVASYANLGVQPETIPDAFYRYTMSYSYLPLAAPPGGTGGSDDQPRLGVFPPHTITGNMGGL